MIWHVIKRTALGAGMVLGPAALLWWATKYHAWATGVIAITMGVVGICYLVGAIALDDE